MVIGATEALWPLECAVNNLADKMGVDPAELRQKNLIAQGEQSLVYAPDEYLDSGSVPRYNKSRKRNGSLG